MEKLCVKITTEYIKLDQLLKLSGVAESGADAKYIIINEKVLLNGEQVSQRGKKIHPSDVVALRETEIHVG